MLFCTISMSLDGFVAGPDPSPDQPLGAGGDELHQWAYAAASWQQAHGQDGGAEGVDSDILRRGIERTGATIMGRRMFSGGSGPWDSDPNANGWWGDEPPFHHPVFVLTHHPREPLELTGTTFTFVTEGVDAAAKLARDAAGGRDVAVAGGGEAVQQFLANGLIEELHLHVAPVLLGSGTRLLANLGDPPPRLTCSDVVTTPAATHLTYRVGR